ncbi:MAG: protein phosphatase, partial [Actinomycetota bacterium]|nr:protein phosphatase [Actinomycetota bacterium]
MVSGWDPSDRRVLVLPSGRLVRGRGLRHPAPEGTVPEFGLYLLSKRPEPVSWDARWIRWPDFRLPADRGDAQDALYEAWERAVSER